MRLCRRQESQTATLVDRDTDQLQLIFQHPGRRNQHHFHTQSLEDFPNLGDSTAVSSTGGLSPAGVNQCGFLGTEVSFTATVSGREMTFTLASPPPAGTTYNCSAALLFQPE